MKNLEKLVKGYKKFTQTSLQDHQERYRALAEEGQSPKIMVIGCCDSRVNPDLIFNAKPGDLFVVRNVANLVPPFEEDDGYHGTSAALEFAVMGLGIQHIVIMGHSLCGGVQACCDALSGKKVQGMFIPRWTGILNECAQQVHEKHPGAPPEQFRRAVELAAIRASMKNLKAFPFIQKGLESGELQIHGAYFDITNAQLYGLDKASGDFLPVE